MPQAFEGGMPVVTLTDSYVIAFEAVDPTTGDPVSGVAVSQSIFTADVEGDISLELASGPFMFVPGPNPTG